MTKITVNIDCGNAPKKEFIKQINIAFAKGDSAFLIDNVEDAFVWIMIGDKKIKGKENFATELEKMKDTKVSELTIDQILTHGKEGAANGAMKMQNGKQFAFSDFYEFSSAKGAKLKSITAYVIEI